MSWLRARRLLAAGGLALLAVLLFAAPASAHADLSSSDPSNGTVLRAEPAAVSLHYSEDVTLRLASVRVIGPDGRELAAGPPAHASGGDAGATLRVPLRRDTSQGTYIVVWHAVAADDGHGTAGVVMFAVGHRSALPVGLAAVTPGGVDPVAQAMLDVTIWLGFVGFALLAGQVTIPVAARLAGVAPRVPGWPAVLGWCVLLAGTLGQLLCYGPYAADASWRRAFDRGLLGDTLATRTGHVLMIRALILVLLAVVGDWLLGWITVARARWRPVVVGSVTLTGLAVTWTAVSHAASGTAAPVQLPVATLHVAAMGVWAGGLVTLLAMLRTASRSAATTEVTRVASRGASVLAAAMPSTPAATSASTPSRSSTATATAATASVARDTCQDTATQDTVTQDTVTQESASQPTASQESATQASADAPPSPISATVRRFSALALGSVCVLAVTGLVQAWYEIGGLTAVTSSGYGRLLLAKAGVLALVLLAASRSRASVRRRDGDADLPALRCSVLIEAFGVLVLLAVVTLLIGSAPPHA